LKQAGLPVTEFTGSHVTVRSPQLPIGSYANSVIPGSNPGEFYISLTTNHVGGPATVSFNGFIAGRLYTVEDFVINVTSQALVAALTDGSEVIVGQTQDLTFTLQQYQRTIPAGLKPVIGTLSGFTAFGGLVNSQPTLVDSATGTYKLNFSAGGGDPSPITITGTARVEEQAFLYQNYPVKLDFRTVAVPLGDLGFTQVTTRLDTSLVQLVRFNLTVDGVPITDATTNKMTVVTSSLSTYAQTLVLDDAATGAYHFQVATNATPGNVKVSLKINHAGNVYTVPDFNITVAVGG